MAIKALGQHWLFDKNTLVKIVKAGKVAKADTILEIGPGHGSLTAQLLKTGAKVVAVEKDSQLADKLKNLFGWTSLKVVNQDILDFDLGEMKKNYKVVANIPYYLTSQLIRRLLEAKNQSKVIVLLVQKEVATRIMAAEGNHSVLSVSVQYYAKPEIVSKVSKDKFSPKPKVDSAILKISPYSKPKYDINAKEFFRLVKIGFSSKRKMLKNNLSAGLHKPASYYSQILKDIKIDDNARAQELSLSDWQRLYQATSN